MAPPLQEAELFVREDHSWTQEDKTQWSVEGMRALLAGGDNFTITARNGFHLRADRQTLEHMMNGVRPEKRADRYKNDGTDLAWLNSDPTLNKAFRFLMSGGGPFEITAPNGYTIHVHKERLAAMCIGLTVKAARPKKNRQGKWRQHWWLMQMPSQEKTPTSVSKFGDEEPMQGRNITNPLGGYSC